MQIDRRHLLGLGAAAVAADAAPALGQTPRSDAGTVRDRLWVFCNPINADYYMVKKRSEMSPVESALYLGVPNIMMVNQTPPDAVKPGDDNFYQAWRSPFDLHAFPTKMLKRVVWSIVGAGGKTNPAERAEIMELAKRTPNFVGITMDDFVHPGGIASLTVEQLKAIQSELKTPEKKLDLYVTLYMSSKPGNKDQIKPFIVPHLEHIDVITIWAWDHAELAHLETHLAKLERLAPKARIILGCYTAALHPPGTSTRWTPLPVETMRHQCETGLRWLQQGRIEGIMIYGNFLDLGWDSVAWTRDWIRRVGDARLTRA